MKTTKLEYLNDKPIIIRCDYKKSRDKNCFI